MQQQATKNVFAPSAFVLCGRAWGLLFMNFLLSKKIPGSFFVPGIKHFKHFNFIVTMRVIQKNKPESKPNKTPKPKFPFRKSIWVIIMLFITIIALSAAILFSPGCFPVSLTLKMWGVEFQLEKGECSLPQLPSQ
ncbi:MAG: hypothetical protein AAGG00_02355 [Cyanobacteria bacterium P01_H01_bin.150]